MAFETQKKDKNKANFQYGYIILPIVERKAVFETADKKVEILYVLPGEPKVTLSDYGKMIMRLSGASEAKVIALIKQNSPFQDLSLLKIIVTDKNALAFCGRIEKQEEQKKVQMEFDF